MMKGWLGRQMEVEMNVVVRVYLGDGDGVGTYLPTKNW